ncbi:MAG: hypothetical protein K2I48_04100 [Muribaculaceae bacterium]|nr:hypothetical protein [Muribaculaceae bacterium]
MYKPNFKNTAPTEFVLNDYTRGYAQCIDNNWNYAIYAQDPGVSIYQNEYNAGYVQGKVQTGKTILATRNNTWRWYVLDEGPGADSTQIPPGGVELAQNALVENYNYLTDWAEKSQTDEKTVSIIRLMFRMLGIYHGAADKEPLKNVTFDNLKLSSMDPEDSKMHVDDQPLTFIDVYFLNAQMDLWDAISKPLGVAFNKLEKDDAEHTLQEEKDRQEDRKLKPGDCSGFVKYLPDGDILWTHTSWCCFMAQTCAVTYVIGDDFLTQNSFCPGQFGSNTDFGFNKHGIGFNETTETYFYNESKTLGIWLTWRAAAAENFARSIDEFYDYVKIDNTGTYLNAYMVVDAYRGEFGLIDMSYARFAYFKADGKSLDVTDSTGYTPTFLDYDHHMVCPTHVLGCNIPIYKRIWRELETIDGAPKRRYQLYRNIPNVSDIESAKALITFNSDKEPISIAGRWDLDFGTSEFLRYQPHGSIDAKCFSTSEIKRVLADLSMKPSINGKKTSFWMKFGSTYIDGKPFVWSDSVFARFKEPEEVDCIPDAIDGRWNLVKMFME